MFRQHMRPVKTDLDVVITGGVVHKLNNIDKCWYPKPKYQKMNHLMKCRL